MISRKWQLNSPKTIAVIGVGSGVGATHLALSIANYLSSVEKYPVLYVEIAKCSSLYKMVRENKCEYRQSVGYQYKGVKYFVSCDLDEARDLIMNCGEHHVVVDISNDMINPSIILNICQRKLVIGSLKPWCNQKYYEFLSYKYINSNSDISMRLLVTNLKTKEKNEIERSYQIKVQNVTLVDDPFRIKEKEFCYIKEIISC